MLTMEQQSLAEKLKCTYPVYHGESSHRFVNRTGQKYGRWTLLYRTNNASCGHSQYVCVCDCGTVAVVSTNALVRGVSKSCGCLRDEKSAQRCKKYNSFDLTSHDYCVGYTEDGDTFLFDLDDYEWIKKYYWSKGSNGYMVTTYKYYDKKGNRHSKTMSLHKMIQQQDMDNKTCLIDHINGDRTDDRKVNLREADHTINLMNQVENSRNTSGRRGVCWIANMKKWKASITVRYHTIILGHYEIIEDAISAREEAEKKYFGEYARKRS